MFQTMHFFGMALACLGFFLLSRVGTANHSNRKPLLVVMTILAVGCVPLLAIEQHFGFLRDYQMVIRLVAGACSGWLYLLWGPFYSGLDIRRAILVLFGSVIMASVLKALLAMLGSPIVSAGAYAVIPVLTIVCWYFASKNLPVSTGVKERYTTRSFWFFKNPLIGIIVFSLVIGILLGMDAGFFTLTVLEQSFTHLVVMLICLMIIVLAYRGSEYMEFSNGWLLVLLTITTGLVVAGFVGGASGPIALAIIAAAQRLVAVFIWLALADIAHNSSFRPDAVFGLGKGVYALFVALGLLLSNALGLGFGDLRLSLLVVYVLTIGLLFFMRDKTPQAVRLFSDLSPQLPQHQIGMLASSVDELAKRYGLSEREKEIVILYAQGRSRSFISAQMFISENTVRDHIRNVYRKMDIHNKQTLIDAIQEKTE
jgi:DNA-binding CsgD family transcriptional regulator